MRQGCKLSLLLFNIYIEQAINECKEYCTGIRLNGMRIQMLKFACDIAIRAQDEINLKKAFEKLRLYLKSNYKMKINMGGAGIEVTVSSKFPENITIKMDDDALKQVPKFKYIYRRWEK